MRVCVNLFKKCFSYQLRCFHRRQIYKNLPEPEKMMHFNLFLPPIASGNAPQTDTYSDRINHLNVVTQRKHGKK